MTEHLQHKAISLADSKILRRALLDSFRKLDPRTMIKNPVMFVVEVGALLNQIQLVRGHLQHVGRFGWGLQITLSLWFTVVFANFAEAMAEGRGKAQADTLRKARAETAARRLRGDGSIETISSSKLRSGDTGVVTAGGGGPGGGGGFEGGGWGEEVVDYRRGSSFGVPGGWRPRRGSIRDQRYVHDHP